MGVDAEYVIQLCYCMSSVAAFKPIVVIKMGDALNCCSVLCHIQTLSTFNRKASVNSKTIANKDMVSSSSYFMIQ